MNLKILFMTFSILNTFTCHSFATESSQIDSVSFTKSEIESTLDSLQGQFQEEDIKKAKEELKNMDQSKLDALTNQAKQYVKDNPDAAKDIANKMSN